MRCSEQNLRNFSSSLIRSSRYVYIRNAICIGNHMISNAIWNGRVQFVVFEKFKDFLSAEGHSFPTRFFPDLSFFTVRYAA